MRVARGWNLSPAGEPVRFWREGAGGGKTNSKAKG